MKHMNQVVARTMHITTVLSELAHSANETTWDGKFALGKLYEFNHNFFEAAKLYRSIPADTKKFPEVRARLAITLFKSGQPDQALTIAQELAQQHPKLCFPSLSTRDVISVHTIVGDAFSAMGREEEAIKAYELALKAQREDFHAAAMAARIALKQGQVARATQFAQVVPAGIQRYDDILALVKLASADQFQLPAAQVSIAKIHCDGV